MACVYPKNAVERQTVATSVLKYNFISDCESNEVTTQATSKPSSVPSECTPHGKGTIEWIY